MILSVGYRVNTRRGTQFRIWATQRLREYLVRGYVAHEKRLQQLGQVVQILGSSSPAPWQLPPHTPLCSCRFPC